MGEVIDFGVQFFAAKLTIGKFAVPCGYEKESSEKAASRFQADFLSADLGFRSQAVEV